MYRLTITQKDMVMPYIVVDAHTLDEVQAYLEDYKKRSDSERKFTNYDVIQYNEVLEDSYTLDDVSFKELRKEGYV